MLTWFSDLRPHWKLIIAPTFLILVLVSVGAYALYMQRNSQHIINVLITGPVRQAEDTAAFAAAAWAAQAHLYRLPAIAANESDEKKIKAFAAQTTAALAAVEEKLHVFDTVDPVRVKTIEVLGKLRPMVATYLKQGKNAIAMADGDPASALMFMGGAERSFADIEAFSQQMVGIAANARDRDVAGADAELNQRALV